MIGVRRGIVKIDKTKGNFGIKINQKEKEERIKVK